MSKFSEKLQSLVERVKKVKHIQVYFALALALIIIAIYLSTLGSPPKEESPQSDINMSSSQEYTQFLENKLVNVLSKIKGAGQVNVVITLENGFEYIYVTEEETRLLADGSKVTTSSVVLVDGQPVLEKEIYPHILGVLVTASGADDIAVRVNLLTALQTVIDVPNESITILTGKK